MSEYVSRHGERLTFFIEFTAFAGTSLVTQDRDLMWRDGRYFVKADTELNTDVVTLVRMFYNDTLEEWALPNWKDSAMIGIDTCTASTEGIRRRYVAIHNNKNKIEITQKLLKKG